MPKDIEKLFGGPDAPDELADTPTEGVVDTGPDEFSDGFATDPKSADLNEMDEPFESRIEAKVDVWNEEFEDDSDRNDRVTDDMAAAVAVRAMGAYEETSAPNASLFDWTMGRVNEFLERSANQDENAGFNVDDAYRQDDDLLPRGFESSTLADDEVDSSNGPDLR